MLPKAWLQALGVEHDVDIVRTSTGILVEPVRPAHRSLEEEPEFGQFLAFLQRASLAHPEHLVNIAELTRGDDELFAGVPLDR